MLRVLLLSFLLLLACAGEPSAEPMAELPLERTAVERELERSPDEAAPVVEPAPDSVRASGAFADAQHQEALRRLASAPAEAEQMLGQGCDRGHAPSCVSLAERLEPSDPERSRALYEQACAEGSTDACDRLGH
jgi:TPR repeat protein